MTSSPTRTRTSPVPLGPNSLFWDEFGSLRFQTMLSQAFLLQVCHPVIEAGVSQHSTYRTDPLGRARRSVKLLWPVLYARPERAIRKGQMLRDMHRSIKGTDKHGKRYHALDPEAYSWVHLTGFDAIVRSHALFGTPLSEHRQEQLFREWRQFGLMMGVSEQYLPRSQQAYWHDFNRMITETLEIDSVARNLLYEDIDFAKPERLKKMPEWAWKAVLKFASQQRRFITRATLPDVFRQRFGIRWRRTDALIFQAYRLGFRATYRLLPERFRFISLAYRARQDARLHPQAYHYESHTHDDAIAV